LLLSDLADAVVVGNDKRANELTQKAIDEGLSPQAVIHDGLCAGMDVVGQKFQSREYYVPHVLLAARAMKTSMNILKPLLQAGDVQYLGGVVIGTSKGDLHDIGKNLVATMLEGAGFEVFDLGTDVTPESFVEQARRRDARLVCISALMITTMPAMKQTVDALAAAGMTENVKVMVGGAPVTQAFADEIGAHGYGENATVAVDVAKSLLNL